MKIELLWQKGETANLIDLCQKAVKLAEKSDNLFYRVMANINLGAYSLKYTEVKNVDEYLDKALAIANEIKSDFALWMVYFIKSKQESHNLDYKPAIEFFEKALEYLEKTGNKSLYYAFKNDLAILYNSQYQLDKALEYFKEALKGGFQEYIMYSNIGHTYFLKYELEKAKEYTLKALELIHGTGADRVIPSILSTLIQISIELDELEKAQEYLTELGKLSDTTEVKWIKNSHRFNSALVLKASSQMTDWIQAIEILKGIIADEDTYPNLRTDSLYQLVTLYLKELQISADKLVLENVKEQISNLKENAEDRKHYHLLVNIYRMQSQLALIELDLKKAVNYLATARVIAEEKGIEVAVKRIEREQEKLNDQMSMWNGFQKNNAPITETIKHVPLKNTTEEITKETLIEVRDEESGKIIEYRKLFALKI
jgi:tetratricopeptide (TPR) repeat protein